jgi:hypothetical protein
MSAEATRNWLEKVPRSRNACEQLSTKRPREKWGKEGFPAIFPVARRLRIQPGEFPETFRIGSR